MTWHNGEGTSSADNAPEVGQRVQHWLFGIGYVTSLHRSGGRDAVSVNFEPPFGTKVLYLSHTQLTVLPDDDGSGTAKQRT